jgi:hypothetical protein
MDPGGRKRRVGMIEYVVPTAGTGIANSGRGCEAGSSSRHGCAAFVSGHGFSRAVEERATRALAPGLFLSALAEKTRNSADASQQGLKPNSLLTLNGPTKVAL